MASVRWIPNDMFFCNSPKRINIVLDLALCKENHAIGFLWKGKMGKVNRHTQITLKPGLHGTKLIGALLHGMVHTVLFQYACCKRSCVLSLAPRSKSSRQWPRKSFHVAGLGCSGVFANFLGFEADLLLAGSVEFAIGTTAIHPSWHDKQMYLPGEACRCARSASRSYAREAGWDQSLLCETSHADGHATAVNAAEDASPDNQLSEDSHQDPQCVFQ